MPEDYPDQFDDVMDFIQATIRRLKRSPEKQMAGRGRPPARRVPEGKAGAARGAEIAAASSPPCI